MPCPHLHKWFLCEPHLRSVQYHLPQHCGWNCPKNPRYRRIRSHPRVRSDAGAEKLSFPRSVPAVFPQTGLPTHSRNGFSDAHNKTAAPSILPMETSPISKSGNLDHRLVQMYVSHVYTPFVRLPLLRLLIEYYIFA